VGDGSLFYRPRNPLLSTIRALLGGPTPSRPGDPAMRFGPDGVTYHQSYERGPVTTLEWPQVRAVAVLPGPIAGRLALCVYRFHEPPAPDIPLSEMWTGTGPGLSLHFTMLFGTPFAVHWHHVRGPSLRKLATRLPTWTDGRITLTTTRPT